MSLVDTFFPLEHSGSFGITSGSNPIVVISDPLENPGLLVKKEAFSIKNNDVDPVFFRLEISGSSTVIYDRIRLRHGDKYTNPSDFMIKSGNNLVLSLEENPAAESSWSIFTIRVID